MINSTYALTKSLKTQRQTLRHQRRLKAWQGIWRFLALGGMMGGMMWLLSLPYWVIKEKSQIEITGNQLLSDEQIQQMLPVSYPQSIWQLPIHQLKEQLDAEPPIDEVQITRQILPAQIKITVRERQPVAEAFERTQGGFLDAQGIWIPAKFYPQGVKLTASRNLKVMGFDQQYGGPYWAKIYPLMLQSPVKITLVDWRDASNLVLKTELGIVHCGSDIKQFSQQLAVLSKMRKLPSRVPTERIAYIDLTNPDSPSVHLKKNV